MANLNRIPKFRAWDKFNENMTFSELTTLSKFFENVERLEKGGNLIKLSQFTGLKDNTKWENLTAEEQLDWIENKSKFGTSEDWNGKEIYEGDILNRGNNRKFEVIFRTETNHDPRTGFFGKRIGKGDWIFRLSYSEVIGNIYENPELKK